MAGTLTNKSCVEFAEALASGQPVPGGGGAAAYAGALGVALASMVGNFTTGKKAYVAVEDDIQRMLETADAIRRRLIALVDEDAAAFYPLSRAYGIPKEDPGRAEVLEEATRAAIVAPVEMMHQCCEAIELLEELCEKGSRMLLSDVGCGVLFARAALEAASLNVFVNTKVLTGLGCSDAAKRIEAGCDELLAAWCPRAEAVEAKVMNCIRGGE